MEWTYELLLGVAYVVLAFVVLVIAKILKDLLTPYRISEELTSRDNPALGVTVMGYFAGTIIIYLGAVIGPTSEEMLDTSEVFVDVGIDFLWAIGGIVALNIGRLIVDKLVLHKFSTVKEIVEDRNVGTAAVEAGCFTATGLIVAGAIHGEGGGPVTALAFFALGQLVLVLFSKVYQLVTSYDVHAEIEKDNVAAGVALGGNMIAFGVIVLSATAGDFVDWPSSLVTFAYSTVLGFALLAVLRRVTDAVLLPGTTIAAEIARDRNINAAWIETVVSVGLATVIFFMI